MQQPTPNAHKELTEVLPSHVYLSGKKGPEMKDALVGLGARAFVYVCDSEPELLKQARERGEGYLWMHVSARAGEGESMLDRFTKVNSFIERMRVDCGGPLSERERRERAAAASINAELAEAGVVADADGGVECGGASVLVCGDELAFGFVVAYLMEKKGMGLKEAFAYVKSRRPSVSPDFGFASQLQSFEKELYHNSDSSFLAQYVLDTLVGWEVSKDDLSAALAKHGNDVNKAIDSLCADEKK